EEERDQGMDDDNGATDPNGRRRDGGVVAQQDDGGEGEQANAKIAAEEQLHVVERCQTVRMMQLCFGAALSLHERVLSHLWLITIAMMAIVYMRWVPKRSPACLMTANTAGLIFAVLRIVGRSGTTHVPAVTNRGLFCSVRAAQCPMTGDTGQSLANRDCKHWLEGREVTYVGEKARHFHKQVQRWQTYKRR